MKEIFAVVKLLELLHNCEDLFHFHSLSTVHLYDLYHIHFTSDYKELERDKPCGAESLLFWISSFLTYCWLYSILVSSHFARLFLVSTVVFTELFDLIFVHESHIGLWFFVILSQLQVVHPVVLEFLCPTEIDDYLLWLETLLLFFHIGSCLMLLLSNCTIARLLMRPSEQINKAPSDIRNPRAVERTSHD